MQLRSPTQISRFLPWIMLIHVLAFTLFWLTNSLFYASTNDYLANMLNRQLNYVSLFVWVSALFGVWSFARIVTLHLRKTRLPGSIRTWLYSFVAVLYLLFFYGSFGLLFKESPVQLIRIGQMWLYFRIIPDTMLVLALALFSG